MKKIFLLMVLAVAIASCKPKKGADEYVISCTVEHSGYEGLQFYLMDLATEEKLDSVIVKDGKFIFRGVSKEPFYARVYYSRRDRADFFIEMEDTIRLHYPLNARPEITGTPMNDEYTRLVKDINALLSPYQAEAEIISNDTSWTDEQQREKLDSVLALLKTSYSEELSKRWAAADKGSMIAAVLLKEYAQFIDEDDFLTKVKELSASAMKFTPLVQQVEMIEKAKQTAVGQKFLDFTIENGNLDGSAVSFSEYVGKGKYVLVDFWASWCGPCKAEIPNLKAVYEKYKGEKFDVLSVAVWDERTDTEAAIKEFALPWAQIVDSKKVATDLYAITGIPHIMLIGPDGTIIARGLQGEEIGAKLEELLK